MIEFHKYDPEKHDPAQIVALHRDTEAAVGQNMDLPSLDLPSILVAEVGEKNGQVKGAFYLESVPECVFIGRDAEVTVSAVRHAPDVLARLAAEGFRVVRIQVPRSLPQAERTMIWEELKKVGFYPTDHIYEHYTIDMRKRGE